jgi:hypothetical protein
MPSANFYIYQVGVHDVGKETKLDLIKQDKAGITLITILDNYYMSSGVIFVPSLKYQ